MNPIYLYFALFYVLPFGIALAMPGWKSLLGCGLTFGLLLIWLFVSGSNGGGNGLAVALGLSMIMFAGAGLISGVITRAIVLATKVKEKALKVRTLIVVLGFFLPPVLVFSQMKWNQWQKRPPSEACLNSKYPTKIAGAVFFLPPAPNLTVWTDMNSLHPFQTNEGIRTICESARNSVEPIPAIHLYIDNQRVKFAGYPVQGRYCQTAAAQWGKNLCNSEYMVTDVSYPIIANVYSGSEFNSRRMLASYSYENFIEARARAKESNTPFVSKLVGAFERYGDDRGFWVARENSWKNEAGEPFTLYCYKTTPVGFLHCSTTYQLKAGPHLAYQFHSPQNDLEIVARRVDKNMRAMLDELSQP